MPQHPAMLPILARRQIIAEKQAALKAAKAKGNA